MQIFTQKEKELKLEAESVCVKLVQKDRHQLKRLEKLQKRQKKEGVEEEKDNATNTIFKWNL